MTDPIIDPTVGSDAWVERFWPGADPNEIRAQLRTALAAADATKRRVPEPIPGARARLAQFITGPTPYVAYRGAPPPGTPRLTTDIALLLEEASVIDMLNELRAAEGATVSILCDNPEASSADVQCAVEVNDDWTGWQDRRFHGRDVRACLAHALEARP